MIEVIIGTNVHAATNKVHLTYYQTIILQIIMMVCMDWFEEANETWQLQSSMAAQSPSHPVVDQIRLVYPYDILILLYNYVVCDH